MRSRLLQARDGQQVLESYLRHHLLGQVFTCGDKAVRVTGWCSDTSRVECALIALHEATRRGDWAPLLAPEWHDLNHIHMELDIGSAGQFTLIADGYRVYSQLIEWTGQYTEWTSYNRHLDWDKVCRYA